MVRVVWFGRPHRFVIINALCLLWFVDDVGMTVLLLLVVVVAIPLTFNPSRRAAY